MPTWASAGRVGLLTLVLTIGYSSFSFSQSGPRLPRKQDDKIPTAPSGPVEQQFPYGASWILSDVNGKPQSGDAPSFNLDDKLRATGFGGCNTFSMALYPIKDQKLAAGSIALTKKTCGKDTDELERTMLVGLHSLPKWHLEPNGDLTLSVQNIVLRFRRGL